MVLLIAFFVWKKKLTVRDVEGVYELEVGFDAVKEGRQRQNLFSYYRCIKAVLRLYEGCIKAVLRLY